MFDKFTQSDTTTFKDLTDYSYHDMKRYCLTGAICYRKYIAFKGVIMFCSNVCSILRAIVEPIQPGLRRVWQSTFFSFFPFFFLFADKHFGL